ncbi:MAG: hypothetical protein GX166_02040 [Clostridiaceae bacterium]|nr:hypothetical protein [Clostridiaceae bacterium]
MKTISILSAKERFLSRFPCDILKEYPVDIEIAREDKLLERIESIFEKKGRDLFTLMSLNEQGQMPNATTLIYQDKAYVLIKDVPKPTDIYITGAVYTETARIYVMKSCCVNRSDILLFSFNANCLIGYGFWTEYATKLIANKLLSEEFSRIRELCTDARYINAGFAQLPYVGINQLTGFYPLADLFSVLMLRKKLGARSISFPIDDTFILGARLKMHADNIYEILLEQSLKEEPYIISDKILIKLGVELRKFDDALFDYKGLTGS